MFEQGLAYLLKKLLGEYVEDGNILQERIQVGVWSGLIVLENLVLKNSVFDLIDVPISLNYGYIGRLELRIPWGNLGVDPVTIIIDKINILIEPKYEWNPGAADKREQAMKQAKLAAAELFANKRLVDDSSWSYKNAAKKWFLSSFVNKIIDNIQITVREVHIRYEDHLSCPSSFCIGLSFESLHVQSRDSKFSFEDNYSPARNYPTNNNYNHYNNLSHNNPMATPLQNHYSKQNNNEKNEMDTTGSDTFFKLIQLNHLSFYWNPLTTSGIDICTCSYIGRSNKEIQSFMSRTIATRIHQFLDRPRHHYILLPVDINAFLDMSFNSTTGVAKAQMKLFVSEISIEFEDRQFREIVSMAVNMSNFAKLERFSEYRPKESVFKNASAWWRYAINAVIIQIRIDRKKRFDWTHLISRARDKLVYIELWKSKLISPSSVTTHLQTTVIVDSNTCKSFDRHSSTIYQSILKRAKEAADLKKKNKQPLRKSTGESKFTASLNSVQISKYDEASSDSVKDTKRSKSIQVQQLNKDTMELLNILEYQLSFEDIILFRSFAEKELSHEDTQQSWLGGLFTWVTGGKSSAVADEEKRKLFEALKYDPERVFRGGKTEADKNEVIAIVFIHLRQGSITLGLTSPDISYLQSSIPFLKFQLNDLKLKSTVMGDGSHIRANLSLQDFEAFELESSQTTVKDFDPNNLSMKNKFIFRREFGVSDNNESPASLLSTPSQSQDKNVVSPPLFSTMVELFPPSLRDTEIVLNVNLEELEIIISPYAKWTDSLNTFITWPEDLKYWSEMEMTAMNQLADIKSRIDAKLEYMMNNHSNMIIEAKLKAPVIIIIDSDYNKKITSDVLVMDLGTLFLHTEKLAKAQRQKNLDMRSHTGFTSDATVTPIPTVFPFKKSSSKDASHSFSGSYNRDVDPDTPYVNDEISYLKKDLVDKLETTSSQEILNKHLDEESDINEIKPKLFSRFRKPSSNYASTINTGFDLDNEETDLFDIFQLQITEIELYLISYDMLHINSSAELDKTKAVIVDKFEISVEIQSSVLPWDSTLPPIKLLIDIPEINVQLSEVKLKRLHQFAIQLSTSSNVIINNNLEKLNKFNDLLKRKSMDMKKRDSLRTKRDSSNGLQFYDSIADINKGSASVTESKKNEIFGRRSPSLDLSGSVVSQMKKRASANNSNTSFRSFDDYEDEDDDKSFFSLDENDNYESLDHANIQIENLRLMILQKENNRNNIMSQIRISESDTSKLNLSQSLKTELLNCESDLHKLKVNYVELLVQSSNIKIPEYEKDINKMDNDEITGFRDFFDSLIMDENTRVDLGHRRDLISASIFKIRPLLTKSNDDDKKLKSIGNKEFIFAKLNISIVNVDLLCSNTLKHNDHSSSSQRRNNRTKRKSKNTSEEKNLHNIDTLFRLRLAGMNIRLRHRNFDSKLNFSLREIDLEDFSYNSKLGLPGPHYSSEQMYLVSSEYSLFDLCSISSMTRKYMPSGSTDFLRIKYEVIYGDASEDIGNVTSHNVRVNIGFVGINVEQVRLSNLFITISNVLSNSSSNLESNGKIPPSQESNPTEVIEKSSETGKLTGTIDDSVDMCENKKPSQSINLMFKIDCFMVSLLDKNQPYCCMTIWSLSNSLQSSMSQFAFSTKLLDFTVHKLSRSPIDTFSSINDNTKDIFEKSILFSKRSDVTIAALSFSMKTDISRDIPLVNASLKAAPFAVSVNLEFIGDVIKFMKEGPLFSVLIMEKKSVNFSEVKQNKEQKNLLENQIDYFINPILDSCSGSMTMIFGGFDVICPTPYNSGLQFTVKGIELKTQWGESSSLNGIEVLFEILGIGLKISDLSIIDGFDMRGLLASVPSIILPCSSIDIPLPLLSFQSIHSPLKIDTINRNEVQLSFSFSPIFFHFNELIISNVCQWISSNQNSFNSIQSILTHNSDDNENHKDVKLFILSKYLAKFQNQDMKNSKIGFNLNFSLKLYEVSFDFETFERLSPVHSKQVDNINRTPRKNDEKYKAPMSAYKSNKKSSMANSKTEKVLLFKTTGRNILFQTNIASNSPKGYEYVINAVPIFCKLDMKLESIDVEYFGNSSYKRLLCTILIPKSDGMKIWIPPNTESSGLLSISVEISDLFDIDVDINLSNMNFTLIPEAIISFLNLTSSYGSNVTFSESFDLGSSDLKYHTVSFNQKYSMDANKRDQKDIASMREDSYAHPSSVPMSLGKEVNKSAIEVVSSQKPLPPALLTRNSFSLPKYINSINVIFTAKSNALWMPSDKNTGIGSAMCASLDIDFNAFDHPQSPGALNERYETFNENNLPEENIPITIWNYNCNLSSVKLFLSKSIPLDILRKIDSFDIKGEGFNQNLDKKFKLSQDFYYSDESKASQKTIILPFDVNISGLVNVIRCRSDPSNILRSTEFNNQLNGSVKFTSTDLFKVEHIIEVNLIDIEVQLFLDYRPLLRIYDYSFNPILEYINMSTYNDNTTQVKPKSAKGSTNLENEEECKITECDCYCIDSSLHLLTSLSMIATSKFNLSLNNFTVFMINDIYYQPLSIARLVGNAVNLKAILLPSIEKSLATKIDIDPQLNPKQSEDTLDSIINLPDKRLGGSEKYSQSKSGNVESSTNFNENLTAKSVVLFECSIESNLRIDYYNQKLIATEPFCEPFNFILNFSIPKTSSDQNNILLFLSTETLFKTPLSSTEALDGLFQNYLFACRNEKTKVHSDTVVSPILHINIRPRIDINITLSLLEILFLTFKSLSTIDIKETNRAQENVKDVSMMTIRNDSGLILKYWTKDINRYEEVLSNSQQPLNLDSHFGSKSYKSSFDGSFDRYYTGISKSINLALYQPGGISWLPLQDISLEGVGCRLLMMEQKSNKQSKKYENKSANSDSSTCVALELISVGGIKTLLVRSTMRVFNSTDMSFKVILVQNVRNSHKEILWESILPPNSSAFVPANFCNVIGSKFMLEPILTYPIKSVLKVNNNIEIAEIPVPEIHGLNTAKMINRTEAISEVSVQESKEEDYNIDYEDGDSNIPNNEIYWRKKLHQMRGAVDTLTYSHWLYFNKRKEKDNNVDLKTQLDNHLQSVFCNLNVISKGVPRSNNARVPESCMLRTLILTPAITVVNLLACDLEVVFIPEFLVQEYEDFNIAYKVNKKLLEPIQKLTLSSGESKDCMNYHSTKTAYMAIMLQNDLIRDKNSWSEIITIPGCKINSSANFTLSFDVLYKNQSNLTVYLDIIDNCGSRIINIYVPYWIVTTSFLNLQFQHETTLMVDQSRNGVDGLAPDQLYEESKSFDDNRSIKLPLEKRSLPRGMGKVRGCAGIVLGPETSLRGFADVLATQNSGLYSSSSSRRLEEMSQLSIHRTNGRSPSVTDGNLVESSDSFSSDHVTLEKPYRLIHCSFTNKEKKIGRIRMRSKGSYWGNQLNLDNLGISDLHLKSVKGFIDHDGDFNRNLSHMSAKEGSHMFPLGVTVSMAEPPFNRTKIVIITDRMALINSIGQSIEVKQFGHDTIFSLRPNGESPMWWRPGQKNIQVRLAKFGWSWSGKFSLSAEGEIPIRLRNDFDNTVFFVLVQIVKQGPKICIIFRGGDKFSPYRFENHTLDTFKIKQKGQSLYTNLLPYHCCAYAWDDPLAPHIFTMEVLTNSLQSQDEWSIVGTYSFDRLQSLESKSKENLVMRVVAQGPTRVLQIFDRRVVTTSGNSDFERNSRIEMNAMKGNKVKIGPFNTFMQSNSLINITKPVKFQININIGSIGISVVDQNPQELIFISISGVNIEYLMCVGQEIISMDLERLQIDNQLWSTPYPSLFYPLVHLKEAEHIGSDNRKKFFSLFIKRDFEYAGIDFFPIIKVVISPFDINLEGTLITRLIKMVSYATETIFSPSLYGSNSKFSDGNIDIPLSMSYYYSSEMINSPFPKMTKIKTVEDLNSVLKALSNPNEYNSIDNKITPIRSAHSSDNSKLNTRNINLSNLLVNKALIVIEKPKDATKQSSKLYIQNIEISEIRLNLSFNPVVTGDSMIGDDSLVKSVVNVILLAIGSTFAKIDNCPIRFKNYQISHLFTSSKGFVEMCTSNYTMQVLGQAYLLLGSSEILGNPVRLLQTVGEGLWDFMYMPTRGLFISPEEFAMGALRGTSSLLRRTVASICSTAGHLASSLQVGLITLGVIDAYPNNDKYPISSTTNNSSSFSVMTDEPHITSSTHKHFIRPSTVLEGLKLGFKGLFTDPITGFRVDGIKGFCIGSLKGFIGFAARPIFGFLGSSSNTLDRISFRLLPRFLGNEKLKLLRARPPRFFHNPNLPLNIYSADENIGQELLSRISGGEYRHEGYVWHSKMSNKTIILMTKIRMMIVCDSFDVIDIVWQCPVNNILSLEIDYTLLLTNNNKWYQEDSLDESDYIIDNSETIADVSDNNIINGKTLKPNNYLKGNPTLHIYHLPLSNHANKSRNITNDKSMGLILADYKISNLPHEGLLELLEKILKLNNKINPTDIQKYLKDTNVDLNRFNNNNNKKLNIASNFIANNNSNYNRGLNNRIKSFSSISSIDNNNNNNNNNNNLNKGIQSRIKSISSTSSNDNFPNTPIRKVSAVDPIS